MSVAGEYLHLAIKVEKKTYAVTYDPSARKPYPLLEMVFEAIKARVQSDSDSTSRAMNTAAKPSEEVRSHIPENLQIVLRAIKKSLSMENINKAKGYLLEMGLQHGIKGQEVETARLAKIQSRGSFSQGIILDRQDGDDGKNTPM